MADIKTINLPDVGDFDEIEIIEILIVPGDSIAVDDDHVARFRARGLQSQELAAPWALRESDCQHHHERYEEARHGSILGTDEARCLCGGQASIRPR